MSTNRSSSSRHHRQLPVTQPYDEWLAGLVSTTEGAGTVITDVRVYRVSSGSPSVFASHLTIGLGASDADPDVAAAIAHGATVVEDTVEGDALRAELGTYTLRFDSLPGGEGKGRLGFVTLLGRTLFLYLLASAAELNLSTGVHHDERSNAAVEACRATVRRLGPPAVAARGWLGVHWTEDTRPARDPAEGLLLARTMSEFGARPCIRGVEIDLETSGGRMQWQMLMGYAANDRDTVNTRMARGKAGLLLAHRLPEKIGGRVPFTHEAAARTVTDPNGRTRVVADPYAPAPVEGIGQVLDALVREVLARAEPAVTAGKPIPWDDLAVWASDTLGLTSRSFSDVAGGEPRALSELANPGPALRRALRPRYVDAWRTGWLEWVTAFNIEVPGVTDRLEDTGTRTKKGKVRRRALVECPRPDTTLTDDEWDRLLAVVAPRSPISGRSLKGRSCPFDSTDTWTAADGTTHCVLGRTKTLQLHRRDPDRALNAGTERILSVVATDVYTGLGRDLEQLAVELAGHTTTLERVPERGHGEAAAAARKRLEDDIAKLDLVIEGTQKSIYRAIGCGDDTAEAEHTARRDAYRSERDELLRRAAATDEPTADEPGDEVCDADFADLAAVAAGLQTDWTEKNVTAVTLPAPLARAVRRLYRGTFRLEENHTTDTVRWHATAHLHLADGTVATHPRTGLVPNRTRNRTGRPTRATRQPRDLLRRRLVDGEALADIAAAAGLAATDSRNSRLHQILTQTLAAGVDGRAVVDPDLRRALIDAPAPGPGLAVWAWMYDSPATAADLHPGYRDHVIATYTDPDRWSAYSWAGADFTDQRRVLDAVLAALAAGEAGYPLLDATVLLDTDYRRAAALLVHRHPVGRRHQPPPLTGNWTHLRGTQLPAPEDRLLLPHPCPHPDCPGRGAGSRSASAANRPVWADHILWVPELAEGVLCTACRRTPDRPDCRYPETYLQRWTRHGRARTALGT